VHLRQLRFDALFRWRCQGTPLGEPAAMMKISMNAPLTIADSQGNLAAAHGEITVISTRGSTTGSLRYTAGAPEGSQPLTLKGQVHVKSIGVDPGPSWLTCQDNPA
jgi:hypothetical protein